MYVSAPAAKCVQSSLPSQPPRIDVCKFRSPESVTTLVKKLRSIRSRFDAGILKN